MKIKIIIRLYIRKNSMKIAIFIQFINYDQFSQELDSIISIRRYFWQRYNINIEHKIKNNQMNISNFIIL